MSIENINPKLTRADFMVNGFVVPEETSTGIYGLFGKYRCLSNFHPYPVRVDGLKYESSEAAYMAQKTLDPRIRIQFALMETGNEAKKAGQQVQLRPDWDTIRVHAMYKVLLCKFTQDEASLEVLLTTGNKYIEETNWWKDRYYGVYGGEGANNLGWILMTIRDHLRLVVEM